MTRRRKAGYLFSVVVIIAVLFAIQRWDYLLFHNIAETLSILVAFSVFLFAWNARQYLENDFFLFLGITLLFVAIIDFVHMLAYYGMGVFPGHGRDLPTQLWIIARFLKAFSLLIAPLFFIRKVNTLLTLSIFTLVVLIGLTLAFTGLFPACYIDGIGLTTFKILSEYVICVLFGVAGFMLYHRREYLGEPVYQLLQAFLAASILSELSFTLYTDVYGFFNMLGHFLKIIAFYLLLRGIVNVGFYQPYSLLFLELKKREEAIRNEVKTLRGIIPICSSCKKIRDDQGAWNQVEVYVKEHSEAEFSHGLCPDCMKKLYPDIEISGEDQR